MGEPAILNGDIRRPRVLVADGNPRVRSALLLLLTQQPGIAVVGECATIEELQSSLIETRASVLLLDWTLAGPDPTSMVHGLHSRCPGLVIIALSARPELHRQTLCAGVEAFVSKIDAPSNLLATIENVVAKRVF